MSAVPVLFRHGDPRFPFLWEDTEQPAARWHGHGEGPAHYFADTPHGAWAEFLRHEEIRDEADLAHVARALYAVEVPDEPAVTPTLELGVVMGDPTTYAACRDEARALRAAGGSRLHAPSAALLAAGASGERVDGGPRAGPPRDGTVIVLFGRRPDLVGWLAVHAGRPGEELLPRVRHFR